MRPQKPTHQPHGTVTRYVSGCSCIDCCEAWAAYAREARDGRAYVRRNLSPARVRRRILELQPHIGLVEIAKRAGVDRTTVRHIRDGKYATVKRETYDAIMGVCGTPSEGTQDA